MTEARLYCFADADSREITPQPLAQVGPMDACRKRRRPHFFSDALLKMAYSNSDAHLFSSSNM